MKKLIFTILIFTISSVSGFAQVNNMTRGVAELMEREIVSELEGVVQSNEVVTKEDIEGSTLQIVASYDYTSSYLFRSTVNSLVDEYRDVYFYKGWNQLTNNQISSTILVENKKDNVAYICLVVFNEKNETSVFSLWNIQLKE